MIQTQIPEIWYSFPELCLFHKGYREMISIPQGLGTVVRANTKTLHRLPYHKEFS